jgi:hypothetical protein
MRILFAAAAVMAVACGVHGPTHVQCTEDTSLLLARDGGRE